MYSLIRNMTILFLLVLLNIGCSTKPKDEGVAEAAAAVAEAASLKITLSLRQKHCLENAVYDMYETIEQGTQGLSAPSDIAEVRRNAHIEFEKCLHVQIRDPKTAEILAWYYNYCNGKNKYETEY